MSLNSYPAWCETCSAVRPSGHGPLIQSRHGRARWVVRCNGVVRSARAAQPVRNAALVVAPVSRPAPQPVAAALAGVAAESAERVRAAAVAAAETAERQRTSAGWVQAFAAAPDAVREREAAQAARREAARVVAERNRTLNPALYPRQAAVAPSVTPAEFTRIHRVMADVFNGEELPSDFVPNSAPEEGRRFAGLELD
jgi:hypothetical protein